MIDTAPVLTIDGPSGSGKGTIAAILAERLGWHLLDSGALYRLIGLSVENSGISFENAGKITELAKNLDVQFGPDSIHMGGVNVTETIRTEEAGNNASKVAAIGSVRDALLDWQRGYARQPGLVADGRDMGTVVFPQAGLKIFLTASAEERANRRYKQLIEKGFNANLADLVSEIQERDERDRNRTVAPLVPADDAIEIDSTSLTIDEVVAQVMGLALEAFPESVK